jgi:glutamyl-tRNA reductase
MPIIACGINHKTAPIALREKVVFPSEKLSVFLQDLAQNENISQAVLLSTCNRSELYCETDNTKPLLDWFCRHHGLAHAELEPAMYFYEDRMAVKHIMQVACGLDSLIVGESQILGQMKDAFMESCANGAVGTLFNRLFQQVFSVAKEVRTNTAIGACPVSVSSAAVNFILQHTNQPLSEQNLVLIGAGSTIDLVLRYLQAHQPKKVTIVNRSIAPAADLAKKYNAQSACLSELNAILPTTDIIVSATNSATPLITDSMFREPLQNNLLILDLAVPRDIAPSVGQLANIKLFSVDDLKTIIQQRQLNREHAAEKARDVIDQKTFEFYSWLKSLDMVSTTIRAYRKQIEDLCNSELSKSLRQIQKGDDPIQVLNKFAHALTQKLLHSPTVQLKQAGSEGRLEILQLAQQLFDIPLEQL